jgi:hypothetical protein
MIAFVLEKEDTSKFWNDVSMHPRLSSYLVLSCTFSLPERIFYVQQGTVLYSGVVCLACTDLQ